MWLNVDTHPNGCLACQTQTGPFVVCSLPSFNIATVEGQLVVDAQLVFCAPTEQRQGCIAEAARAVGYISPDEAGNLTRQYADALKHVATLEDELAHAEADKMVSVPELLKFLGEDAASDAAAA